MENVVRQKTVVKSGGVIEIRSPELPEGAVAEVIVILETPRTEHLGWPADFLEQFAGSLPDFPDIEPEGTYETRAKFS
jgi:hypothetical protein